MRNNVFSIREYPDFIAIPGYSKLKSKNLGEKFALINSFFFDYLKEFHIPVGYIKPAEKNSLKFFNYIQFPFSIKILNIVDERNSKLILKKEGELLNLPIFEIYYLGETDYLISESHLIAFDLCTIEDIKIINRLCSKINAVLKSFFERRNLVLAEVTCTFGKRNSKIVLVDDFTPKSLKVLPLDPGTEDIPNPYNLTSAERLRKYTDQLINIMSN